MSVRKSLFIIVAATSFFMAFQLIASELAISVDKSTEKQELSMWNSAPALPYTVQEIYPAYYQGHIVVAGGLSPDVDENDIGVSARVVVFDFKSQSWKEGPALPEPRHHPMLVVVGDRLLSFGGFIVGANGAWRNSQDVLELLPDPTNPDADILEKGQWQKISQLPAPLAETLSAVHNGVVHLATGRTPIDSKKNSRWNDQTDVATHYVFDPKTLNWSEGVPAPTARNSACGVSYNGRFHTIAGRTVAGGNLASHEAYDFANQAWQKLAPLPAAQGGLACAAIEDKIYVFGGEFFNDGGGVYADVWEYNARVDNWRSVSKMPKPRHGLGALTIDDKIYVIAGALQAGGNQTSNIMSVFANE